MKKKFEIIRDVQEKVGYWNFEETEQCVGTKREKLDTGDYCIDGMQKIFTIERKRNTGELSANISQPRFDRELARMHKLRHSFLVLEFTLEDVYKFPIGSGIPSNKWCDLKVSANYILKRLLEIETSYNVKVIFAGNRGEEIAYVIMKRMAEMYG